MKRYFLKRFIYLAFFAAIIGVGFLDEAAAASTTDQLHFRWRDDSTALNTSEGWLATEDTNMTSAVKETTYRLRIEAANTGEDDESSARRYQLQCGEKISSCSNISTWAAVGHWQTNTFSMVDSIHMSDGQSATALLSNTEAYTAVAGQGEDISDATWFIGPLTTGKYTENEYSFKATETAVTGKTYCFRMYDSGSNNPLDAYTVYPTLTFSAPTTTFTLDSYRWYVDNNATNPADIWGNIDLAENTPITVLPAGNDPPNAVQELRLRTNFTVNTNPLSATDQQFKLQYKPGTDGDCTSGSWTSVGAAQTWEFATSGVTDGTLITSSLGSSDIAGQYAKANPTTTNTNSATATQQIEYDFHLLGTNISDATQYSFRVIESDDTVFDGYTNCPTLRTQPGMNNMMRGGNFFTPDTGTEEGFFWTE